MSNGVVYVPLNSGVLDMLDESNGNLIASKFIGGALITQPAIAADANGDVKLVMPASGGAQPGAFVFGGFGSVNSPGFLFALSLPPASGVTTTVISTVSGSPSSAAPSGIDPTTFYGVTALAVIFLITTGVLAVRRRKPVA